MSSKKFQFCNNCGKSGHPYHRCKKPITSVGIIAFRIKDDVRQYLMICRRNSLGYVDFMRGKYPLSNKIYLTNIIYEMTDIEKESLLKNDFPTLWGNLWGDFIGCQYRGEEKISQDKFTRIKYGINDIILEQLIKESKSSWKEPEWGFPKGRRDYQETDLSCALREFQEETGYSKKQLNIIIYIKN